MPNLLTYDAFWLSLLSYSSHMCDHNNCQVSKRKRVNGSYHLIHKYNAEDCLSNTNQKKKHIIGSVKMKSAALTTINHFRFHLVSHTHTHIYTNKKTEIHIRRYIEIHALMSVYTEITQKYCINI